MHIEIFFDILHCYTYFDEYFSFDIITVIDMQWSDFNHMANS